MTKTKTKASQQKQAAQGGSLDRHASHMKVAQGQFDARASHMKVAQGQFNRASAIMRAEGLQQRHKKEAVHLLQAASDAGFAPAQCELAKLHLTGEVGVEKNKTLAFSLFLQASKNHHIQAQCNLADCYRDAIGCKRDLHKMVHHYRAAAKGGHAEAKYNLAICYRDGLGVPRSVEKQVDLYSQAASLGVPSAQFNLAMMYIHGEVPGKPMKHYVAAVPLLSGACKGQHPSAAYCLADAYRHGQMGVAKDETKALKLYKQAARGGFQKASALLRDWPPWKM